MARIASERALTEATAAQLKQLLRERSVAALGTLHAGAPYVSMVPYAIAPDGSALLIHVSRLASHTKDMRADARVSLLVMQEEGGGTSALALPRASIQGMAQELASDAPDLPGFRAAYLERFPEASQLFGFADFSLFKIQPESVRFVAGFGRAHTFSRGSFKRLLAG
ncbi:MAG: pyridoxamine 5'-phosphate oxidase family protein [Betaproteobacteria bacterium]|nr:pyridoxamine 5'-phosphate oxidase family protein [Betaproteobacteria bacterium]